MKRILSIGITAIIAFIVGVLCTVILSRGGDWHGHTSRLLRTTLHRMGVTPTMHNHGVYQDGTIRLNLSGQDVSDISPLYGMPLQELSLEGTKVSDISPIGECHTLRKLNLSSTLVSDLSRLNVVNLKELMLNATQVTDLRPIAHLDLTSLDLSGTQVQDLSPLTNMNLEALYIYKTPITDLTPVAHMAPMHFGFSEDLLPEGPKGTDIVQGWTNCTINLYSYSHVFWKEYEERKRKKDAEPEN
ncbi:MAG: hypothetical protein PHR35_06300 [Kiritimatiellae bacterium]|nr:hypothetical protein [Kiritimatiellia bacterium]